MRDLPSHPRPAAIETRADRLVRALSDEIVSGRLGPGIRLDEQSLADRFGLSRTPVREALGQLAAIGLAEKRPHRGVLVANFTIERMRHMFELMAELEALCARLAARRMIPDAKALLEEEHIATEVLARNGDFEGYEAANRAFHRAIYDGSANPVLVEATEDARRRLSPFRRAQFHLEGRIAKSFAEHGGVIAAILAGDEEAAYARMRDHLLIVQDASTTFVAGSLAVGTN
ncbi:GntR family transcriptional regulator [uncultured Amaricoccus sp.]|uniref:GntR family transcriptional regulator n=1 Tax=uncultured Amaricoccus sp. TaxID=339341 RepID=UPI002615C82E|nr:GntR family transcriptional regulator [uncultured Amaricoccus sp.]